MADSTDDRLRRWALVLGKSSEGGMSFSLSGDDAEMSKALHFLYGDDSARGGGGGRGAGLGASSPFVARWLGDIRNYFPKSVVQVMQRDALERLELRQMLLEPELLETVEVDVHLVANLVAMSGVIPKKTKETARRVVRALVEDLEKRLGNPMRAAIRGALNRASRTSRPRPNEIDWHRTIRKNLDNYLPEKKLLIAERVVGYARGRSSLRDIIVCVDQSGSMASSVVYASIFGAVMASIRAVRTSFVLFDTEVVDMTPELKDPVDLLFGTQLGGGTDINRAVAYCETLVREPGKTILVLVTDLYEGGDSKALLGRVRRLVQGGVNVICLLALSDEGEPYYDHALAGAFASLGVPAFACTPDQFPGLIAAAIRREDVVGWAAKNGVGVARG